MNQIWEIFGYLVSNIFFFVKSLNFFFVGAHGVGHGLVQIFGFNNRGVSNAIRVCENSDNQQFQYACATGVYMESVDYFSSGSLFPCQHRFPAACFRFKTKMFEYLNNQTGPPCEMVYELYHKIGCIWGSSYVSKDPLGNFYDACKIYLPSSDEEETDVKLYFHASCLDGFLASKFAGAVISAETATNMCKQFKGFPISYDVCKHHTSVNVKQFTFSQDKEFYYNYNLLEHFFNSTSNVQ